MRKWRKSHVSNVTTQGEGVGVEQKDHKRLQIAIILKQTKGGGGGEESTFTSRKHGLHLKIRNLKCQKKKNTKKQ